MAARDVTPRWAFALLAAMASSALAAVAVAALVAFGWLEFSVFDTERILRPYGERIAAGEVPYRDVQIEYPPGSLPTIVGPALVSSSAFGYRTVFVLCMVACAFALLALAAWTGLRLGLSRRDAFARVLTVAAVLVGVSSVAFTRFDLWPALLVAVWLALAVAGRDRLGGVALGVAVATKLFPLVLLPIAAIWAWRRRGRRVAVETMAGCVVTTAVVFAPFLALSWSETLDGVTRQARRPLEIESLGASIALVLDELGLMTTRLVGSYGSTNLSGSGLGVVSALTTVLGLVLLVAAWLRFWRAPAEPRQLVLASAAALAIVLAFAKLLSPQFLVWLIPAVVLVAGRTGAAVRALLVAAAVLTGMWYPDGFTQLVINGIRSDGLAILVVRDVLLAVLALVLLFPATARERVPARSPSPAPSPGRM